MRREVLPDSDIDHDSPPLSIEYKCNACGAKRTEEFAWASVNPLRDQLDGGDGVCLSRIVACKTCGASDDYTVTPKSVLGLMMRGITGNGVRSEDGRVTLSPMRLWDGTPVRRPSQALAHLRMLAAQEPPRAEAFRRLGNALERFDDLPGALVAWQKAVEVDAADLEAAYSLANAYWQSEGGEGLAVRYLDVALKALPLALRARPELRRFGDAAVGLLAEVVGETDEPFALVAAWSGGQVKGQHMVNLSSVDAHKIGNFKRLAEFIARPDVMSVGLVTELPTEEPTRLQLLLSGQDDAAEHVPTWTLPPRAQPVRVAATVGRNAPCPCGSGRKYKRCCGG